VLILVVLTVESAFEMMAFDNTLFHLSGRQILLGAPLTFVIFFIGTVLPTIVEGWSTFNSPRNIVLSLIFVLLQYCGPGMIKSVLMLRTGNAWVHALGYHIIAPHVIVDTPLMVKIFGIVP
jgi:hypothetical protein